MKEGDEEKYVIIFQNIIYFTKQFSNEGNEWLNNYVLYMYIINAIFLNRDWI